MSDVLLDNTGNIRNICVLAHVDHGKTTLSDSLIASNGIISKKMAGKVRYLDSREDEQTRGITMESSAIALSFKTINQKKEISTYLINLIDSPGHIDFSSEVSTVSRLSDGALIVVDVVEGVCSQTITVLRQAWIDNLKPVLVLNKIDRLILELQLTPDDAFDHLQRLIDQTNNIMASFYQGDVIAHHSNWNGDENTWIESSDADIYFDPNLNNVIFTSAYDGWGFNLNQFAAILARKTGFERNKFDGKLWGDYTLDMKNKKVVEINRSKSKARPLFSSFILESIWKIYNSINDRDHDAIIKITNSLSIKLPTKELNSKDTKSLTQSIMSQFLPLSNSILSCIVDKLPSPIIAQSKKIEPLLASIPNSEMIDPQLKKDMIECNKEGFICAYISKMLSIPSSELPENQPTVLTQDQIYERGRIAREKAAKLAEMAAKLEHSNGSINNDNDESDLPSAKDEYEFEFEVEEEQEEEDNDNLDDQLEEIQSEVLIAFTRVYSGTIKLNDKITILSPLFDTSKPYNSEENSQHCHEITVERLYILMGRDMTPISKAPAGSIVGLVSSDLNNIILKSGTIVSTDLVKENATVNFAQSKAIIDLPPIVRVTLEPSKLQHMERLISGIKQLNLADPCVRGFLSEEGEVVLETAGELHLERCIRDLEQRFAKINITVGKPIVPYRETILDVVENSVVIDDKVVKFKVSPLEEISDEENEAILFKSKYNDILIRSASDDSVDGVFRGAFNLAVKEGPLINEPLENVKVEIISIEHCDYQDSTITKIRDAINDAVLKASPRIKLAMYTVDIQTSAELLGKVYTVIQKRRGQILTEEMKEGTPFFTVEAKLPVLNSFGFSEEIRKKTSGGAIPQLVFSGYETVLEDPFWVPTTEEELEDLGEKADKELWIKSVMNEVRKSKGLFVDEKVVENAEKQRTLKKD
ncbi:hypothetical protein CANINC_002314 [Pichia inconspicua]|uniref:Ribosome assembly protein 1 n=1 Tax=Pichia inconspicua TaxID=52247 RepID=A0A4T0X368_9ASCO|nr:hypothetical protein CANINC_002314 [[Candida] inconspicua]